jgi:hypothetical protein
MNLSSSRRESYKPFLRVGILPSTFSSFTFLVSIWPVPQRKPSANTFGCQEAGPPIIKGRLDNLGTEPELVHDLIFCIGEFSRRVSVNREHIPSRAMRHAALSRFDQRQVFVQTTTVRPTLCPGSFIARIEKPITQTQRGYDFREPMEFWGHRSRQIIPRGATESYSDRTPGTRRVKIDAEEIQLPTRPLT